MIGPLNDRASFARLASGRRARCGAVRLRYVQPGVPVTPRRGALDRADATDTDVQGVGDRQVRVAYAISRRAGNAVMRNRIRRRLRAALFELDRTHPSALAPGDYLFTGSAELSTVPFRDLQQMVQRAVTAVALVDGGDPSARGA